MRKGTRLLLGVGISVGALALIVREIQWARLQTVLESANYWYVLPFLVVETASIWARGMRWRVLLRGKIGVWRMFWITNVGYFLNNVLPLRVGELARVYLVARNNKVGGMEALSTAVVERMLDLFMVFAMLFAVMRWVPQEGFLPLVGVRVATIVMVGLVALFVVARWRESVVGFTAPIAGRLHPVLAQIVREHVASFLAHVQNVRGRVLLRSALWTATSWVLSAGSVYVLLLGFSSHAEWQVGVFATCILALGLAIPSAPSGVGLWESATVFALGVFGIASEDALAFALLMHITVFVKMTMLGLLGLEREGESFRGLAESANRFRSSLSRRSKQAP